MDKNSAKTGQGCQRMTPVIIWHPWEHSEGLFGTWQSICAISETNGTDRPRWAQMDKNSAKTGQGCQRMTPWLTDGIDGRGLCTLIFSVIRPPPRKKSTGMIELYREKPFASATARHRPTSRFWSSSPPKFKKFANWLTTWKMIENKLV